METTARPLVLVELDDLDTADLDAALRAELDEPAAGLPLDAAAADELAALLADVLRSTGTAAALAHRLGAHAALLAD
ncbi:hypothetical protein GCM10027451_46620 [Geodermatophilus aquaeductus]|uniref:Uncharacterized protein n=1 Tax=Geodermatophilus aquaeductus TaxID=1564161 RepID=A0A521FT01_9ACTN|nr:hypothetical protein [Geodermatophilus aquaeductus]SMO99308.1 hypothetical protein SAMN06273567_11614 [Geodermatophilus aquaeductus]